MKLAQFALDRAALEAARGLLTEDVTYSLCWRSCNHSTPEAHEGKNGGGGEPDVLWLRAWSRELAPFFCLGVTLCECLRGVTGRDALVALDVDPYGPFPVDSDMGESFGGLVRAEGTSFVPRVGMCLEML